MAQAEMQRVNTRISLKLNEWLDKESAETGLPKSTIIMLAVESYWQQKEAMKSMSGLGEVIQKLEEVEKAIKQGGGK